MSLPATDRTAADQAAARLRSRALLPGLSGGVLALVTGSQPWWRATGEGVTATFTGTESTAGLASALAVVALAGWLLVLVLRTRGHQVVALLLGLTTGRGALDAAQRGWLLVVVVAAVAAAVALPVGRAHHPDLAVASASRRT